MLLLRTTKKSFETCFVQELKVLNLNKTVIGVFAVFIYGSVCLCEINISWDVGDPEPS